MPRHDRIQSSHLCLWLQMGKLRLGGPSRPASPPPCRTAAALGQESGLQRARSLSSLLHPRERLPAAPQSCWRQPARMSPRRPGGRPARCAALQGVSCVAGHWDFHVGQAEPPFPGRWLGKLRPEREPPRGSETAGLRV